MIRMKTIIYLMIVLILVSLVSAEINTNSVIKHNDSYFSETIHPDWNKKSLYFKNVFSWWYDSYLELKQENQMLRDRLTVIENLLNISDESKSLDIEISSLYYCSTNPTRNETCVCLSESNITCYYEICGENTAGNYGRCTGGEWILI